KADLDDLVRRYPEVGGRQIGIEVHRREYTLSPYRHPGHFAARNNHHSSRVERDLLRVDPAQTGVAAGESQPLHDIGMFHKSKAQQASGDASTDWSQLHPLFGATRGASVVIVETSSMRSCNTRLCRRWWVSASGMPEVAAVKIAAAPGSRM